MAQSPEEYGQPSNMIRYWFGDQNGSQWIPALSDCQSLYERFTGPGSTMSCSPSPCLGVKSGFCQSESEYYQHLRSFCMHWAGTVITDYNQSDEAQLIRLVLILREIDTLVSRVTEQVSVWNRMINSSSSKGYVQDSGTIISQHAGDDPDMVCLSRISRDIGSIRGARSQVSELISKKAMYLLPNCSHLVGPLVAARLLAAAGSRKHLAEMPASGIQVLGAKNALFSHLSTGSPSPKHGLIYEHKRIHAAPRKVRGRVARTLAANLAIAARIDNYRNSLDQEFLDRADRLIKENGRSV
jgi:nucleolar protein 56